MKPKKTDVKIGALEKQLKASENKANKLRIDIQKIKDANKPKSIMDLVKNFNDACKLKKVKPESVYNSKVDAPDEIAYKKLKFAINVLNEGHKFTMKPDENRYYPYYNISSGFVFDGTVFGHSGAATGSASRLCLKTRELAEYSAKILHNEYKQFIM